MFGNHSEYAALRSPLSPVEASIMNKTSTGPSPTSVCNNDQMPAKSGLLFKTGAFDSPPTIYLFNCGSASGWQESAELNLLKAEAVLLDLIPKINNLSRREADRDGPAAKQDPDRQSIFSRLSRSSKISRKVSGACSCRALKMLIKADRMSIWGFLTQARGEIKQQRYFVKQAMDKDVTPQEAEDWFEQAKIADRLLESRFIGERFVHYVPRPKKHGTALLCQTKVYKNELRAQEARLLYIEKAVKELLA